MYLLSSFKSYSFLLLYFLHLLSSDESDSLDDKSDNYGSDSWSSGICTFPFRFDNSIGCVHDVGSEFLF